MRRLMWLGLVALIAGCAPPKAAEIRAGDVCYRCRRTIAEPKLAGELVQKNGMAFKFRTVHCMAQYIAGQPAPIAEQGTFFVTDYTTGRLIQAGRATYVIATIDDMTNERDYLAYGDANQAKAAAQQHASQIYDWAAVVKSGQQARVAN